MGTNRGFILGLLPAAALALAVPAPGQPPPSPEAVFIEAARNRIEFRYGRALAGAYLFGPDVAKPYFWPLQTPGGDPITRSWPMERTPVGEATDHVHQKSAWFCHGDVIPEGMELKQKAKGVEGVDFWTEGPGHGRIVSKQVGDVQQVRNHGRVTTVNEWLTADGRRVLDEVRTIHLYNYGDAQLFVLDFDLHASVVPITFGDTKEGSLGVRVRQSLAEAGGKGRITNADGKVGEKDCWGMKSAWCDYSGPVGRAVAGIAVLADPSNPYPTYWHVRGYGLLAANPFGRAKSGFPGAKGQKSLVKLAKGEHLKLRYGLLLHMGDAREGRVADYYEIFTKLKDEK